jgi:Ca2+/Na+ antiporter
MVYINWVYISVGFTIGVFASYFVCDLVFPIKKKNK